MPSCFSTHAVKSCPFYGIFRSTFSHFCENGFAKKGPKHSVKLLFSVAKSKRAVTYFTKKICVMDKLISGMSYSAVVCEFDANVSTVYILKRCLSIGTNIF